jgi:glycosyltransferase involved in cell wall biosynthesis
MPLVSVVMPVFHALSTIERSVRSVLNQTHVTIELIVVLDGRDLAIQAILEDIRSKDLRIKLVCSFKNRGTIRSRNLGVRLAGGDFIAFCDADDYWLPEKLSEQLDLIIREQSGIVCSGYYYQKFGVDRVVPAVLPKRLSLQAMRYSNFIALSTAMYSVKRVGKCYFSEQSVGLIHEDYDLWLNLLYKQKATLSFVKKSLVVIVLMPSSRSSKKALALSSHVSILTKYITRQKCKLILLVASYLFFGVVKRLRLYSPVSS